MPSPRLDDPFDASFDEMVDTLPHRDYDLFDRLFNSDFEDEDILFELSTREDYPQLVLNFDNYCNRQNQTDDLFCGYISGLTNLTKMLAQVGDNAILELWLTSDRQKDNCVLSTIFQILPNCYPELCLPKVTDVNGIDNDDNAMQIRISFYEHLALDICNFIASLTTDLFRSLEPIIFKQLLSAQSVCQMLASDVLCFVARFSKKPLAYQLCSVLISLCDHMSDSQLPNVASLLSRLLPFLQELELEYLLRDYDLFSKSRIWRLVDIRKVLNERHIKEIIDTFTAAIEKGDPFTKYQINLLKSLMTENTENTANAILRQKLFDISAETFFVSTEPELYSDLIELMSVLMPKQIEDYFVQRLAEKLNKVFGQTNCYEFDESFVEILTIFFTNLAQNINNAMETSKSMETLVSSLISSSIRELYKICYTFYAKYFVFKALENISLTTRLSVLTQCLQDKDLKHQLKTYLIKIKDIQRGYVMPIKDKINHLKTIEPKLNHQIDFKTSEEMCGRNGFLSQISITNGGHQGSDESIVSMIDSWIDAIDQNVKNLSEEQTNSLTKRQKQRLTSIGVDFNNFIVKSNSFRT